MSNTYEVSGSFRLTVEVEDDLDAIWIENEEDYYDHVDEILKGVEEGNYDMANIILEATDLA